jgi:hypothetical protein
MYHSVLAAALALYKLGMCLPQPLLIALASVCACGLQVCVWLQLRGV